MSHNSKLWLDGTRCLYYAIANQKLWSLKSKFHANWLGNTHSHQELVTWALQNSTQSLEVGCVWSWIRNGDRSCCVWSILHPKLILLYYSSWIDSYTMNVEVFILLFLPLVFQLLENNVIIATLLGRNIRWIKQWNFIESNLTFMWISNDGDAHDPSTSKFGTQPLPCRW